MPLFGKRPPDRSEEERRAAEVDLERIRRGGIPLAAEERLRGAESSGRPFSSDLSAKEYALADASGLVAIAQVMGSSVVRRGWPVGSGMYGAGMYGGGLQEIDALAEPWNLSRERSFERLRHEARAAGADAVIGIEMRMQPFLGEPSQLELAVFGTAVRETSLPVGVGSSGSASGSSRRDGVSGEPRLSTLSGQDVDKLRRIGAETLGVIGHTVVVSCGLSPMSNRAMSGWWGNQEMREVSFAVSSARARAMDEVVRQGRAIGANDMVISMLGHTIEHGEFDSPGGYTSHYFIITMNVLATAIRLGAHDPHPAPLPDPVMSISLGA
ncbi:MAG: heavy metal-binding domain-containing protein [Solirubrobacterales bacterium]|nr:heavy metal-binding domain-containing protein [Solirubrobacterales bacterium]